MNHIIIVNEENVGKVINMKYYIKMRIRKFFDKINCQVVENENHTVVFHVKTSKKIFNEIKAELEVLYPNTCTYLQTKEET